MPMSRPLFLPMIGPSCNAAGGGFLRSLVVLGPFVLGLEFLVKRNNEWSSAEASAIYN